MVKSPARALARRLALAVGVAGCGRDPSAASVSSAASSSPPARASAPSPAPAASAAPAASSAPPAASSAAAPAAFPREPTCPVAWGCVDQSFCIKPSAQPPSPALAEPFERCPLQQGGASFSRSRSEARRRSAPDACCYGKLQPAPRAVPGRPLWLAGRRAQAALAAGAWG